MHRIDAPAATAGIHTPKLSLGARGVPPPPFDFSLVPKLSLGMHRADIPAATAEIYTPKLSLGARGQEDDDWE